MASTPTFVRRRLKRLRRRQQRELKVPTVIRSSAPFRFDAALRIGGAGEEHQAIRDQTTLLPSYSHRKGDAIGKSRTAVKAEDIWILESPLGEAASLDHHLQWIWQTIAPHKEFFGTLLKKAKWANVCLGCLSESAYPVLQVEAASLVLLRELDLQLSFNFTCA